MNEISKWPQPQAETENPPAKPSRRIWPWAVAVAVIALAGGAWFGLSHRGGSQVAEAAIPPASVTVSKPLLRDVDTRIGFIGGPPLPPSFIRGVRLNSPHTITITLSSNPRPERSLSSALTAMSTFGR